MDAADPDTIAESGKRGFFQDVCEGLSGVQKTLPCKYLYDEHGSQIFDRICELDEYYVTRTELTILRDRMPEIVAELGGGVVLIEPGAGSGVKTRLLLTQAEIDTYVPIDISGDYLAGVADTLRADFPALPIEPVVGDFTQPFELPATIDKVAPRVLYFPGSTIGNFTPDQAVQLLGKWTELVGASGRLLIGVDLEKDAEVLEAAYDDRDGVTAAFNLNLLTRIENDLGGSLDRSQWSHRAVYNRSKRRVEMHLVSATDQSITIGDRSFEIDADETIHTENSHKYSPERFARIAAEAGWAVDRVWTDENNLFSVQLLSVA